ncbi:uncharacterized protein [Lolium perenne]|uniref:uncharacterized protein isoform X2 n=1 Tax=Lolium perenne TaxID=4522 RepID=UPI0021F642C7|nr:uncharacterized protein LOC127297636 isoform X2 [Lolium perenne]
MEGLAALRLTYKNVPTWCRELCRVCESVRANKSHSTRRRTCSATKSLPRETTTLRSPSLTLQGSLPDNFLRSSMAPITSRGSLACESVLPSGASRGHLYCNPPGRSRHCLSHDVVRIVGRDNGTKVNVMLGGIHVNMCQLLLGLFLDVLRGETQDYRCFTCIKGSKSRLIPQGFDWSARSADRGVTTCKRRKRQNR